MSHCVSCGIADYHFYTPTSFRKKGLSQSKDRPWQEGIAEKTCLWSLSRCSGRRTKQYRQSRYSGTLRSYSHQAYYGVVIYYHCSNSLFVEISGESAPGKQGVYLQIILGGHFVGIGNFYLPTQILGNLFLPI